MGVPGVSLVSVAVLYAAWLLLRASCAASRCRRQPQWCTAQDRAARELDEMRRKRETLLQMTDEVGDSSESSEDDAPVRPRRRGGWL
jgi:hypothetical protein